MWEREKGREDKFKVHSFSACLSGPDALSGSTFMEFLATGEGIEVAMIFHEST